MVPNMLSGEPSITPPIDRPTQSNLWLHRLHLNDTPGHRGSTPIRGSCPRAGDCCSASTAASPTKTSSSAKPNSITGTCQWAFASRGNEVMNALKEKPSKGRWLYGSGVVVEDAADSCPVSRNESLHLDALDPDLATLLRPNCLREKQQLNFQNENPFVSMQKHQPFQSLPLRGFFPPPRAVTPKSRPSCPSKPLPALHHQVCKIAILPIRTTSPHAYSSLARAAPTRHMPRIMPSVTDRATSTVAHRCMKIHAVLPFSAI
ncbi:hypothetical protein BC826DRAFT_1061050 [Russula brevipes]|nr:hypothetical protein BC826DRAFT_1061050 [Russula brevipes]